MTGPPPEVELPPAPWWVRTAAKVVPWLPFGRYRVLHALPRRRAPFAMRLPRRAGGYRFRCDLRDSISREVCFTGQYEPQETLLLRALLRPGMTFLDVGASWGYHTLLAAGLVTPSGRVVSLEPDPRSFAALCWNLAANALAHATPLHLAAADEAGTLPLAGYQESGGNAGLSRLAVAGAAATHWVPASPLDAVLDGLGVGRVDLVKMDIEGAEGAALRGLAARLQAAQVDRVLLELHPGQLAEQGSGVAQVVAFLQGHGYRGWRVDHSPAMTRQAAYATRLDPRALLQPFESAADLDSWPHTLWTAPELDALSSDLGRQRETSLANA
jgi:FkbM family methyltransferase